MLVFYILIVSAIYVIILAPDLINELLPSFNSVPGKHATSFPTFRK
ncbi:Hypothetical protein MCYN_0397 [Mycoplasmopsis cynos C142]|uniref:Uncharacterized protein n=1 Tax=Mycoplasmopsis cynos (strain C142) TaxID=1246955 RepID=L0RUN1_MYCC1|nr:Hypothetical protein MCYN_0397 [Mycoplasmopsis cynos C142]